MSNLSKQEKRALESFKERVVREFADRVDSLQLFGSKARGEAVKHSDVDVLVIMDTVTFDDKMTISGIVFDIMLETGVLLSVKKFTRQEVRVMKEGHALFWQTIAPDLIRL